MTGLVLASGSLTRQALLRAAGVPFTVMPADIDEPALMAKLQGEGVALPAVAGALADAKALAVSRQASGQIVLGGDTVLILDGELISKSPDLAHLKALLWRLSGRTHSLVSAAALARDGDILWRHSERTEMVMRPLSETFLDTYLTRGGAALLGSVGGYHLEGLGAQLFAGAKGDYFSILGLPLLPVLAALRAEGVLET